MTDREFDRMLKGRAQGEAFRVAPGTRARLDEELERALAGEPARRSPGTARVLIAAALLLIALAGIAYAAVRAGYIRNVLLKGNTDISESQVVAVNASDEADAFSLSIDEAFWEGDRLLLSYTLRVPEGGSYFVAFEVPTLGGASMSYQTGQFISDSIVYLVGGEQTEVSGMLEVIAEADGDAREIALNAWLMRPLVELRGMSADEYAEYSNPEGVYGIRSDEVLVYVDASESYLGGGTSISLGAYRSVQEYIDAHWVATCESTVPPDGGTPAKTTDRCLPGVGMLEELGFAQTVDELTVSFQLDGAAQSLSPACGVAQREFKMDGYTLRIRKFTLSHMGLRVVFFLYPDAEDDPAALYDSAIHKYAYDLRTPEGVSILDSIPSGSWNGLTTDEGGIACVQYDYSGSGFLAAIPDELVLVPYRLDKRLNQRVYAEDEAILLTLVPEDEAEGASEGMTYASAESKYHHRVSDCMGMVGAELVEIQVAEERGQTACPICYPYGAQ